MNLRFSDSTKIFLSIFVLTFVFGLGYFGGEISPLNFLLEFNHSIVQTAYADSGCGDKCQECKSSECQDWNFSKDKCVDTCPDGKTCRKGYKKADRCKWSNICPSEGCGEGFCLVSQDTCEPCDGPSSSGGAGGCSAPITGNDPCSTDPTSTGSCNFESPCDKHDQCYSSCGDKKTKCDSNFGSNMMDSCSDKEGENKEDCEWWADEYESTVEGWGSSAYKEAQRGDCC